MERSLQIKNLRQICKKIDKRNRKNWISKLDDRKQKESQFHDLKHKGLDKAEKAKAVDTYEAVYTNRKYYRAVSGCNHYLDKWIIDNCSQKIVLDYCCGVGGSAIKAAKAGADLVIGIDISEYSISVAEQRAVDEEVNDKIIFIVGDAENTGLPDECVERGLCSGVLHHLDLDYAIPELYRLGSKGSIFLALEALDYNPAIKLYRMMTPDIRTEWEKAHILSLKDVKKIRNLFAVPRPKYWHLLGILGAHLPQIFQPILNSTDRILEKIPLIQLLCWIFTFEMRKE